jgi:DNA helicase IV
MRTWWTSGAGPYRADEIPEPGIDARTTLLRPRCAEVRIVPHPDVDAEQAYLDDAYRCLAAMRVRTARAASIAEGAAQAVDSAIAQQHLAHRFGSLEVDVPGLSFGRLDGDDGARWYVGRHHVEDDRGEPVVVDWRADVAMPFYRATAVDPLGLRRRRRFMMTGRHLDDLFDEVFADPASVDAAHHGGIPDPLLAELERERTGEMRDIVATIAAEQDDVIRAPLETCLVVQGGPGTGKTAVGLHRAAAFLLYEHRRELDAAGVLVVGPNPIFLRYIAQVLPSLGETAVRQTTLERLLAGTAYRRRGRDGDDAARLKGDARLAAVLARAVATSVQPPEDRVEAATPWGMVRLDADAVFDAVADVHARGVPHNVGRAALRTRLVRLARQELAARRGEEVASLDAVDASLRSDRGWQRALDRTWPAINPAALVRRLLTNRNALRAAGAGPLDPDEQELLLRPPTRRVSDEPWTVDDLALLDEADALLAGPPAAYGQVVVDEAQDLSAMGFRALGRRSPARWMTVLGDLAQATAPAAQSSWDDVVGHLGAPATARRADLDLGYRVPAAIVDVANLLLADAAPGVTPCRSVRLDGRPPQFLAVEAAHGTEGVHDRIEAAVAELTGRYTSVAVIAPPGLAPAAHRLPGATVLAPPDAKGLEFDAVVVAEPATIAGGTAQGLRLLYVALTRAVQELIVVHARPLPSALSSGGRTGVP